MKKIKKLALRGLKVQIKSYGIVLRIPRLSLLSVTGMEIYSKWIAKKLYTLQSATHPFQREGTLIYINHITELNYDERTITTFKDKLHNTVFTICYFFKSRYNKI